MKVSKIAINRPVTTVMLMFIIIVVGIVSYLKLPLDLFPQMNIPYAIVRTTYEGAGPSEIESLVTKPLEQVLGTVSNIKEVSSMSSNEQSIVVLEFVDGTDMDLAALDVREKIDLIKSALPSGTSAPMVMKIDPNAMAIMEVGLTGDVDLVEMKRIIDDGILNRIERIKGVASVSVSGAKEKEIKITMLPEKMAGYGISTAQIAQILRMENLNLPVGQANYGEQSLLVRTVGEFSNIEDIRNLPIQTASGTVSLKDMAVITEDFKEMNSWSYMNGTPSINLSIEKQSTANTVEVSKAIKTEIANLQKDYSEIQFSFLSDNSKLIEISIDSVVDSAVQGAVLALLILFIFLRNFRSTVIVGVAIPVSIIFSFVLMYFFNLSLNIVSLGGLTLGIGMLVDNSIVVLENIYRHREDGLRRAEAAYTGVKEVGMAVIASTFTTVAVFLPLIYVEGMVAQVFKDMSLTITFSLLASLIVALTVVPMMASKMLKIEKRDESKKKRLITRLLDGWGVLLDRIDGVYRKVLNWCIHRKAVTCFLMLIILVVSAYLGIMNGAELMPSVEMGTFSVSASTPQGSSMDKNYEIAERIQLELKDIQEIKNIYVTVTNGQSGAMSLMGGSGSNAVRITADVGSKSERERTVAEIVDEVRNDLEGKIAGAELSFQASEMSMSTGKPVAIQISGDDYKVLENITADVMEIVQSVEGTREITSSLDEGQMEAQIEINRNKAAMYGLNMQTIAGALQNAVTGNIATTYKVNGTEIDVRVVYDPTKVEYMKDIENISIPSQLVGNVPLSDIGSIRIEESPSTIRRESNKRVVMVEADLFGVATNTANEQIEEKLAAYSMPQGYHYEIAGEMEELEESFNSLALAIAAAVLLVYMVLAAQFESFLHPFTIMFSIPLSVTGAVLGLVIAGKPISMPALIGILMLVGIVVNNAIVLVDYIIQLRADGMTRTEAILKAGPTRLRPIMMTMMTTVLALVPMSLGMGEGTDMMAPLAISVIGGLLLSTFTTLVIIPVIYDIFDRLVERRKRKKSGMTEGRETVSV